MPFKLIVDVFSGRANPEMQLDEKTTRQLLSKLPVSSLRKISDATTNPFPSVLGYRGFILEQTGRINKKLPLRIHYAHDTIYAGDKSARAEDGLETVVFDKFRSLKGIKEVPDFRKKLERLVREYLDKRRLYIDKYRKLIPGLLDDYHFPLKPVCPCAPSADLAAWNTDPAVTSYNNCYNYASNYRTDTFGQPGLASGQVWNDLSACNVGAGKISAKMGAVADGLIDKPNQDNKCISPGHVVALVIDPNSDYHWFRKGSNGKWSHKPGGTPATILDNSGNPITDPRTADRGGYTDFCTFMQVKHGHFRINGWYD